ncbi:MAG: hypothetical protein LBP76_07180 [Treponema sp.]|jgi:hypothetical protein|nr:hypothetical protein [Treponema sp.]
MNILRSSYRGGRAVISVYSYIVILFFCISGLSAQESGGSEPYDPLPAETADTPETPAGTDPADDADNPIPPYLDTELLRKRITEEAPSELVSLTLGDAEVSLFTSGFWKGTLSANWGLASTPLGVNAVSTDSPILFTQEVDLTLSLWVADRWFVEASFLDDYALNTYRAGYQGFEGEAVQYVGIGNTGLDFPRFPYLDLGGDSPSSFGIYGKFGGGDLTLHTLFRYDAAVREERIFVGDRERTYSYLPLDKPVRGRSFVLPHENLDTIPVVYLEDKNGGIVDSDNRHWRLAEAGEYASSARYGIVELAIEPDGLVAVAYSFGGRAVGDIVDDAGWSYTGSGFLRQVQDFFNGTDLRQYPQPGGGHDKPGKVRFPQGTALVIYEPGTFSPFERQSRYQSPTSGSASASLVSLSHGERIPGYALTPVDSILLDSGVPLYPAGEIKRDVYVLSEDRSGTGERALKTLWPLGETHPELYLPGQRKFEEDMGVRFTNYGSSGAYNIGTDVVPGSVEIFRGGLSDPHFTYNSSAGTVSLSYPAGFNEIIRITYLKRSEGQRLGSIAAGLGAIYAPDDSHFGAEMALGIRWNVDPESFSEEGSTSPGTLGIGAKTSWNYDNFKADVTLGFGFEQPDTGGLYRINGMEGNELIISLTGETAFISNQPSSPAGLTGANRAPLVYRNYKDSSILGTSTLMNIDWNAPVVSGQSGPYPAMDPRLSSQVLVAEFSLDTLRVWSGFQVPLGPEGDMLEQAEAVDIPFRFYGFDGNSGNFKVYVQFGAMQDKDALYTDNPNLIVEAAVFPRPAASPSGTDTLNEDARIVTLSLNDADRRKLKNARYMRVIVKAESGTVAGRILVSPPIIRGSLFRPIIAGAGGIDAAPDAANRSVNVEETVQGRAGLTAKYPELIERLHTKKDGGQRVLRVNWINTENGESAGLDSRLGVIPFSSYRTLSFFVRGPEADAASDQAALNRGSLHVLVGRGPSSLGNLNGTILEAILPLAEFGPGEWSKVEIRYAGKDTGITVDGRTVSGANLVYKPGNVSTSGGVSLGDDGGGKSSYLAVFISPQGANLPAGSLTYPGTPEKLPDGSMFIDEFILEESVPSARVNLGSRAEWKKSGVLLAVNNVPILEDVSLQTAVETGLQGNPFEESTENSGTITGQAGAGISVLGVKLEGDVHYSISNDSRSWSAGHKLSRAWGPFDLSERFAVDPLGRAMLHTVGMNLSAPFKASVSADISADEVRLQRRWKTAWNITPFQKVPFSLSLEAGALWTENENDDGDFSAYGAAWLESWPAVLPDLGMSAVRRETNGLFKLGLATIPWGAELSLDALSAFSLQNGTTQSATGLRFDVPFSKNDFKMLFRLDRKITWSLYYLGGDVLDDERRHIKSLEDSAGLWSSAPIYSLFSPDHQKAMNTMLTRSQDQTEYASFNDKFSFSVQLPGFYGLPSLFLPQKIEAQLERALYRKLDTLQDTLNLGTSLGFQALNMFGDFGAVPLFKFYANDEFSHTLDTALAFPQDGGEPAYRIQSTFETVFYGFKDSSLAVTNTFTTSSINANRDNRWQESVAVSWSVPSANTLLGVFYRWVSGIINTQSSWLSLSSLTRMDHEKIRKETLEFIYDMSGDYPRYGFVLGHESIVRIEGRLNLSLFAKLNIQHVNETKSSTFIGTIGTSLHVMF